MLTGSGKASERPFTDENGRVNFDVDQVNINNGRVEISSRGEGFVRIQQDTSRAGGFGT